MRELRHACGQRAHVHKSLLHLWFIPGTYALGRRPAVWQTGALMLIAALVVVEYAALILILGIG